MQVPFLDLRKEFKLYEKAAYAAFKKLCGTQQWILSKEVEAFEQRAAAFIRAPHALGVSSGTDALVLALRGLAIHRYKKQFFTKDDEVLVPAFTFVASAESIIRAGGTPVFVDVEYDSYTISPEAIERAITPRTRGIIVVHLYGLACDMQRIMQIARKHNLFVVEDCAQSFGAQSSDGKMTGSIGDCGCFSFFPTKNLGAFGDAGLITATDGKIYKLLRALRNHGGEDKYNIDYIGYNARLDAIQAEVLSIKLKFLKKFLANRRKIAGWYTQGLSDIRGNISTPAMSAEHTFNQYTIKVLGCKRDALAQYLKENGITTQVYYPVALHTMKVFKPFAKAAGLAVTEQLRDTVLSLPVHPLLARAEVAYVIRQIKQFFSKR